MFILCLVLFAFLVLAITFANRAQFGPTKKFQGLVRRSLFIASAIAAMITGGVFIAQRVSANAPNDFGPVAVGASSSAQIITITGQDGTTIDSVGMIYSGAENYPAGSVDYSDANGGTCQNGFVFSAANNDQCTVNLKFSPLALGRRNGAVEVGGQIGGQEAVLGTAYVTGTGTGAQTSFTPGTISQPVTIGAAITGGTLDSLGNAYVTTDGLIISMSPSGVRTDFAGSAGSEDYVDGSPADARFNRPTGIALDGAGAIYIADTGNNAIRKIAHNHVTTIAGGPGKSGPDGGLAIDASLNAPTAVAIDAAGNIYIADNGNFRIRKIDAITGIITTVAGNGTSGYAGDGGQGTDPAAQIGTVSALALDANGNLLFNDTTNSAIRELNTSGVLIAIAGSPGATGATGDGGPATNAELNSPGGMIVDAGGAIFFADTGNGAVRRIDTTGVINTVAGILGTPGSEVDGSAVLSSLNQPIAVGFDAAGKLHIFDAASTGTVDQVDAQTVPTLDFGSVSQNRLSTVQSVTVENSGTTAVTVNSITASTGFTVNGTSTCQGLGVAITVAPGATCQVDISASPTSAQTVGAQYAGTVAVTTSLNTETISVSATATGEPAHLVFVNPPTATITAGSSVSSVGSPVTVQEQDAGNSNANGNGDVVLLSVSGPNNLHFAYTATANSSGLASFDLSSPNDALSTAGSYSYVATVTTSGSQGAVTPSSAATVQVNPGPPASIQATLPTAGQVGVQLNAITATIIDANNNTVTSSSDQIMTTVTGPGGYSSSVPVNAGGGVATLPLNNLAAFTTAGTYTIFVNDTTSAGVTQLSGTLTVTGGTPVSLSSPSPTLPPTQAAGTNTLTSTQVNILDSNSNVVASSSDVIKVAVTGPGSYSQALTQAAVNGVATLDLSALPPFNTAGSYTVVFSDTTTAVPAITSNFTVSAGAASKIAVTVPNVTAGSTLGTLTATIEDAAGNTVTTSSAVVTGTVSGPNGYLQAVPQTTAVNGVATINLSGLPAFNIAGTYSITLSATGGLAITKPFTVTAGAASKLTVAAFPTSITAGGNLGTISVTIADAFGNTVTTSTAPVTVGITGPGGFTFTSGPVDAVNGVAAINLSGTPLNTAGAYSVTVASSNLTSPAATPVTVTAQTTAGFVGVAGFPASIATGGSGTVTVTVQDALHNTSTGFTGTVTLTSSDPNAVFTPASYTYTNADAGVHMFAVTLNTSGTQSITATTGGVSGSQTGIAVGKVATTAALALTPGGTSSAYGVAESLTATIAPATAGSISAGGTVQFKDNGTALGAPVAVAGGTAHLNLMLPAVGTHSYTALYSGDANFAGATSNTVPFVVALSATTTTLTSSAASSSEGAQITFTATVAGAGTGTPTGSVSFFDATTLLGTSNLGAGGTATLAASFQTTGSHSITAVYGGDASFTGSTSAEFVEVVGHAFTLSLNPSSLNLNRGDNGIVGVSVASSSSFSGNVSLSCSNLPSTMECDFNPSTVNLSAGSSQTVQLVLKTSGVFNKPTAMLQGNGTGNNDAPVFPALAFWMPGAALSAFGLRRKGMDGRKRQALLLVVLMLGMGGLLGLTGCGSGNGATTPAGTYAINVVETSGAMVNSAPLTVVIQ